MKSVKVQKQVSQIKKTFCCACVRVQKYVCVLTFTNRWPSTQTFSMCAGGGKKRGNAYPQIIQTCEGTHTLVARPTPTRTHTRPLFGWMVSHSAGNSMLSPLLPIGWLAVLTCRETDRDAEQRERSDKLSMCEILRKGEQTVFNAPQRSLSYTHSDTETESLQKLQREMLRQTQPCFLH